MSSSFLAAATRATLPMSCSLADCVLDHPQRLCCFSCCMLDADCDWIPESPLTTKSCNHVDQDEAQRDCDGQVAQP